MLRYQANSKTVLLDKKSLGSLLEASSSMALRWAQKKRTLNQVTAHPAPTKGLPETATGQRPLRDAAFRCLLSGIQEPKLRLVVSDKAVPNARASFKLSSWLLLQP